MDSERLDEQQLRSMSTSELVRLALGEARLLARAEVLHAKEEIRGELKAAKMSGILIGAGGAAALCAISVLLVALALLFPIVEPLAVALVGVVVLVLGGGLALAGVRKLPRQPLPKTQERLKRDVAIAREQLT
ncbi:MAG TPA: phage holin family protein [Myxococcaceae bacterium]|nr:phage holin family protein [Myxococcaceae bacterium]